MTHHAELEHDTKFLWFLIINETFCRSSQTDVASSLKILQYRSRRCRDINIHYIYKYPPYTNVAARKGSVLKAITRISDDFLSGFVESLSLKPNMIPNYSDAKWKLFTSQICIWICTRHNQHEAYLQECLFLLYVSFVIFSTFVWARWLVNLFIGITRGI